MRPFKCTRKAAISPRGADVMTRGRHTLALTLAMSPVGITALLISTALSTWDFIIHENLYSFVFFILMVGVADVYLTV